MQATGVRRQDGPSSPSSYMDDLPGQSVECTCFQKQTLNLHAKAAELRRANAARADASRTLPDSPSAAETAVGHSRPRGAASRTSR